MKIMALAALGLALAGGVAIAQPQNGNHNHGGPAGQNQPGHGPAGPGAGHPGNGQGGGGPGGRGPGGNSHPGPGAGSHGHHLPPGIRAPGAHHRAPVWSGHSWAVGEFFALSGFNGPYIRNWGDYGLPPAHPGAHWIYVDGWYLMVGNRTGRIIDEVPADY